MSATPENSGAALTAATPYRGFVKVYREPLDHPIFRGRMDWLGAWVLVQAATDYKTNHVNLTDVGRRAARDFGWDNEKWRRFVKRLAKEGFIRIVEMKNLGDKIGHRQIALVLDPNSEQSGSDSTIGGLRGEMRERNGDHDALDPTKVRSVAGSDEVQNEGAVGCVLKEQRKKEKKEDAVVRSSEQDENLRVSQDDNYRGVDQKFEKEVGPEVALTESRLQSNAATVDEIYSEDAQIARQFFATLVGGNFVGWLDRKIRDGDYRKDLFEHWWQEYRDEDLDEAWQLAQNVRNHRNNLPFGERLTYIDLLNGNINQFERAELRVWVQQQEERKEEQRLSVSLYYSDEGATKAFLEVVMESNKLPSVIDIFDAESLEALNAYVELDEVKESRRKAATAFLTNTGEKNIYSFINAAPNPEAGVSFFLRYFANSKYFGRDEAALLGVLETFEGWNLIDLQVTPEVGWVDCRPTEISKWKVPQP